jgi:two-component system, OmpR family, phosphate regulon sensor histidine kinase PhoR
LNWLMPRILAGALALFVGGWLGSLIGRNIDAPILSTLIGSLSVLAILAAVDSLRGYRLITWLRGAQVAAAPRESGLWGEIGYRMERSLRALELEVSREQSRLAQFLSAIEASPNGVLLLDSMQQIEWCNSVAADHFGLDPKRDLRQPVTNLVRAPAFVTYLRDARFDGPITFTGPNGQISLSVLIRRYGEGQLLILSRDITERERSDAIRRDFVANVSHEIRTPLTVLTGFIETMSQLRLSEAERKRVLTLMAQQAHRMQTLVSDLLMLAQLEGSPLPTAERWVPLTRLLQQLEAEAKSISQGRHLLLFDEPGGIVIAGIESELLSAIGNLVQNAVRYTQSGGKIEVTWRQMADGSGQLSVSDTGPGIAREHLSRLTERFYRVDGSRSRDTGGTGLGLAIVKHVIQRHGGELTIESEVGKGSTFRLVFPAARTRAPEDRLVRPERSGHVVASET